MKIIYVNTPHQDLTTENPQLIDGEIKQWTVETHMLKLGQTLREFLEDRHNHAELRFPGVSEGFYLYNVEPVGPSVGNKPACGLFVRCAYIREK